MIKDDAEVLALFREAMVKQEGGDKRSQEATTCNNVTGGNAVTGNSRAYSIDRVRREFDEETVQQVMSVDLSPNAALVKAGIRENRQVYMSRDPAKAATKIRQQFGDEFAGEAWFSANEVCSVLGYSNPRDAVARHVDKEDVVKRDTLSYGGSQGAIFANEASCPFTQLLKMP